MGQNLSLASITRNFLPCQVASLAIFSNGVIEHVFRYLREDSQMKSIFQRIPSNGLYLLILGHNGSMQHWAKQSPRADNTSVRFDFDYDVISCSHLFPQIRLEHSNLYPVKFQTNQHYSCPGQKNVFCNFFRWVTKRRMMMPWGTWKVLSKLGYFIFCQSWSKTWAGKELIWGNWAIFYFSIMFMRKEVWGKLVTFDLFSAWDWGVPGNVLAEHMGFIKTSCRVSWLFTFLSFRNLTPLIRLNIWNINLFWVSQLRSIVTQDTVLQLAEVQHQISCYLQFWIW